MHIGQVAKLLSEVLQIKPAITEAVSRRLRDAGFIRSGARGKNAPHISDLETSRLLIALMSSESPAESVQRCKFFARLSLQGSVSSIPASWALNEDRDTFEQHLAALLRYLRKNPTEATAVYISMEIYFGAAEIVYDATPHDPETHFHTNFAAPIELPLGDRHPYLNGIHRISRIFGPILASIAAQVTEE